MKILTWGPNTVHRRLGSWWQLVGVCCKSSLSLVYILKKKGNSTLAALSPWASLVLVQVCMVITTAGATMATAGFEM